MFDSGVAEHEALHFKEYNVSQYANKKNINHFHGSAVSYIAQEIAPEADPTMTKDRFMELAERTARIVQSPMPLYDDNADEVAIMSGRTEEKYPIKVIDINALLQAIEEEKAQRE